MAVHSIVLQNPFGGEITATEILGRIGFSAPSEPDGGDGLLVTALISAVAEEAFTDTANKTKILFSTANGDAATARLAITGDGHLVPAADNTYDLGTASLEFRNGYFEDLSLASTGVINFGSGDITLTHATDTLTLGGTNGTLISAPASGPSGKTGEVGKFTRTAAGNVWVLIDASAVNTDEEAQLRLKSGTAGKCRLYFGDTDDPDIGQICYEHDDNSLGIKTNNTTAISIDSSQTATFSQTTSSVGYAISAVVTESGTSRTLAAGDNGKVIVCTNGSATTITVPASLATGFAVTVIQAGAGQITFSASSTTINNRQSHTKTAGQHARVGLVQTSSDTYNLGGDTAS